MTLLYDLKATQTAALGPGGGGEYSRALLRRLLARTDHGTVAGFLHPGVPLDPDIAELVSRYGVETHPVGTSGELQHLLSSGKYDRFMSVLPYNLYDLDFGGMDVFFVVHGLRPLERAIPWSGRHYARGLSGRGKWLLKYVVERSRPDWRRRQFQGLLDVSCRSLHIVVPSWHTLYSLRQKLRVGPQVQLHRFYSPETAVCQVKEPDPAVLERIGVERGRYLFMVSGRRWIKNAQPALKAAVELMSRQPVEKRLPVVITGGVPGGLPRGWRRHVVSVGNLDLEELAALYRGARAFVYPTLNEGFGYPPLEAMAQGTPVICSAISSTTEVVGEAGIYFSPTCTDELRIRLQIALEGDSLLAEYAERGRYRFAAVRQRQEQDLDTLCDLLLGGPTP